MRHVVALHTTLLYSVLGASIVQPVLDLTSLGHVAVAGQFSGISIYDDSRQTATHNASAHDGLFLLESPTGLYTNLGQTDGIIHATCALRVRNDDLIFVGGNFSTIGNVSAINVASYNPSTNRFSTLSNGVLGTVNTLFCDNSTSQVYIGGAFDMSNSTNAVVWDVNAQRFETVPFGGFDGPVNSIESDGTTILFGGQFDSLSGESESSSNVPQQINLQTAFIASENAYTTNAGFSLTNSILCPSGEDGPGSTWLLSDNQAGSWSARTNFTFRPSSFRIYNTRYGGRGTREFRFIAQPINGILNLTYVDPTNGEQAYCDSRCPLSDLTGIEFQEFKFVNVIEMNGFDLAISGWYGTGGGLRGFELFTEDINTYAIQAYNEPTCANSSFTTTTSNSGSWQPVVIGNEPGYLAANINGLALSQDSVTFEPQISQRGNYSVRIYTPGCLLDDTCTSRGGVVLSVYAQPDVPATTITIFQTNNYDKYDTIYQGIVTPSSASFRPRVELAPMPGQSGTVNTVASRVQFLELSASGATNLNGLFAYDPAVFSSTTSSNDSLNSVNANLSFDAVVRAVVIDSATTYVAGNLTGDGIANIFQVTGTTASPLGNAGLNGAVSSMILVGRVLYIAGDFTALVNSTVSARYVVAYNLTSNDWVALGAGLNAPATYLFTAGLYIGVSGLFSRTNSFGDASPTVAQGTTFWDPVSMQWNPSGNLLDGIVRSALSYNQSLLVAGDIRGTYQVAAQGIASLVTRGPSQQLANVNLPLAATASAGEDSDIYTGTFYNSSTTSLTVIGGRFTTTDSNRNVISNVAFITANHTVFGLPDGTLSNGSVVYSSHIDGQRVLLGGSLSGTSGSSTLGGLMIYDLETRSLDATQPAALQGTNVQVNSISTRPGVAQIVVAGNFESAGSLTCPSLCVLDRATTTWQRPAIGLSGNVSSSAWLGQNILLLAGNMTLNGTTQYLATFNFATQTFSAVTRDLLPGPALVAVSDTNATNSIYVAGQTLTGSAYLAKWDGNSTLDLSSGLGTGSQIYGLQFVPLLKKAATENTVMDSKRNLLVVGNLTLSNSGSYSGALFDGVTYRPYFLSNTQSRAPGVIRTLFSEQLISFTSSGSNLSRGVVVVIALAIALFITFAIVAIGILTAVIRRRREGYRLANQTIPEKTPQHPANSQSPYPDGSYGHQKDGPLKI